MSGELYPIAGSKIYIGGVVTAKGAVTLSDFNGASWTEISGWANAGELGDSQEVGEQVLINESRVRKFKTSLNAGQMDNQFVPMALDSGQKKFKTAIGECRPYQFKIEWGGDCAPSDEVQITAAEPGVVTWNNHGLTDGQPVVLSGDGAPPTGLSKGTVYYVVSSTTNNFSLAATSGGAGIKTTGSQSGVVIASAPPVGMTDYFYGLAMPGPRSGGGAADVHLRTWSIAVDSNVVEV